MKKTIIRVIVASVMLVAFTACSPQQSSDPAELMVVGISLSDKGVTVDGTAAPEDSSAPVYVAKDIIFYPENQSDSYGEGEADEMHPQREADMHTVVHITQPGTYMVTGTLSNGQIAVDLGENAKKNPDAVVNLILNDVNLTSTVAPAIVCYSAYECCSDDTDTATKDVNTEKAGFNITLADGSVNNIQGGHVAKIYKPGTTDKLHKYDAAIESLVSVNFNGTDGVLNVTADNEGIETRLNMTINGGVFNINSADDSLNAGEDYVSVITINDGQVYCNSNGGSEGDGIDSNGWIVINGGTVTAFANEKSRDSGLDSDNGIYINSGTVYATGSMYDNISRESRQPVAVLSFSGRISKNDCVILETRQGENTAFQSVADHTVMMYSSPQLTEGEYVFYKAAGVTVDCTNGICTDIADISDKIQLGHTERGGFRGGRNPAADMPQGTLPEMPQGGFDEENGMKQPGDRPHMPDGQGMPPPDDFDGERPEIDRQGRPVGFGGEGDFDFEPSSLSPVFAVAKGVNMFSAVQEYTAE